MNDCKNKYRTLNVKRKKKQQLKVKEDKYLSLNSMNS